MRLARKITLPLALFAFLALGLSGWFSVRDAVALHHNDIEHDQGLSGRTLVAALERERVRGTFEQGAKVLLDEANRDAARTEVKLLRVADAGLSEERRAQLGRGETVFELDIWSSAQTWLAVTLGDGSPGVIWLHEPLVAEAQFLRSAIWRQVLHAGTLALLWGVVALGLGAVVVGRPMRALAHKARRVSRGDYTGPLEVTQRDEIGELAAEMNHMCDELLAARGRLDAETGEKERAQEALRHADRLTTVGLLASGIAHELGTPLNVVAMRARMIASREVEGAEAQQNAEIVRQQADHMTRIIRQLLDFARRSTPELTSVELGALCSATATLLQPLADRAQVTLEVQAPAPVRVKADANQLQQVLTNLVVNAVQAMPGGGPVTIRAGTRAQTPPPDVGGPHGTFAVLEVQDRGEGIAPAHRSRLFEPFFTTKPVGDGNGLGLPVAWGIVRDHRGWIDVDSTQGAGSTFRVFLPVEPTA